MPEEKVICSGLVERIGLDDASISYKTDTLDIEQQHLIKDHKAGLNLIAQLLLDQNTGVIKSTSDITVIGHRVVHGGSTFSETVAITDTVKQKI